MIENSQELMNKDTVKPVLPYERNACIKMETSAELSATCIYMNSSSSDSPAISVRTQSICPSCENQSDTQTLWGGTYM